MKKNVLILGCGRSGTSIFGEFFDHMSDYNYLSEPSYKSVKMLSFERPVAIKVPTESAEFKATPGLSFPLDDLMTTFPDPKIIYWIVRHPLDTICSLKIGIAKNWGHHPKPDDWKDWLDKPLIQQCGHHWNYINSVGFNQVKDLVIVKKFEDLVLQPAEFATAICGEIGEIYDDNRHELKAWINRVQNSNNKQFIEAKTSRAYSRKDHTVRVERWKENLSTKEVEALKPIIENTAAMMGYVDF